jgi:formylglycine-generating enzyme required for sulfatase activity
LNRVYLIHDAQGERRFSDKDFPLRLGGSCADIVLADLPSETIVAYLALAEGHVYLQPAEPDRPLYHNHERIINSVWLKSGDIVEISDALLNWSVQGDQILVNLVQQASNDNSRQLPLAKPPQTPINHSNSLPDQPAKKSRRHRFVYLVYGLFGLLIIIALFVINAMAVRIRIEPVPDAIQLRGFPPAVPVGDRYLMLPGEYDLLAQRVGYYPLQTSVTLAKGGMNEFDYNLQPLPGRLQVNLTPPVAYTLSVDGMQVMPEEENLFLIEGGNRILRVETERYLPAQRELEILGFGKAQAIDFILQPAWANVRIESEPAGASVQVDDQLRGETPLDVELLAGLRNLQLSLSGYKTLTLQQSIKAGSDLVLDSILLQPADAQLTINSEPAGATVSIDGRYSGKTPIEVSVSSRKEHQIDLTKAGYRVAKKHVMLAPEEQHSLSLKLSPEYGTVFLTTQPADAQLLIDGKPAGAATRRLRLTTRPHRLEIRKQGYTSQQIPVTPRSGVSQSFAVKLQRTTQTPAIKAGTDLSLPKTITAHGGYKLHIIRPEGQFTMGASRREPGRRANESRRTIALTRPFFLGTQEVSNAQYRLFRPAHQSGTLDGAGLDGDDQPVVNIAWEDAAQYCNWLSTKDGLPSAYQEQAGKLTLVRPPNTGYRLPTEAEWAYAARAYQRSQPARYAWSGSYPPTTLAGNYADARIADTLVDVVPGYDDGYRGTAPPGSYPASPAGWYDLSGNVAEWVNDYYTVYPSAGTTLVRNPLGPVSGQHHVVRGSSWRHGNITELRLSFRDYSSKPRSDLGFRIARYAE